MSNRLLGWANVQELVLQQLTPSTIQLKRGDFGEVLTAELLEQFHEYTVPVRKLRLKATANQSVTGTDTLAIKLDASGSIQEMCYSESKLRTRRDARVAIDGARQLLADYESEFPEILMVLGQILFDRSDNLFPSWREYMKTRKDIRELDAFSLVLYFEHENWSDDVLDNLEAEQLEIPNLTVHVSALSELSLLIDKVYKYAGFLGADVDE